MKRAGRILLRLVVGLVALAIILAVACLDAVDYQPLVKSTYYQETKARLAAGAATNTLARGEVFAGFGRARLTPTFGSAGDNAAAGYFHEIPLAGFGNRKGRPATGVHDDVFVKAAAIRVAGRLGIMFGVDALIIPREVSDAATERLDKEFGLERNQLYFSATHTHCSLGAWGPGIVGEMFAGKYNRNSPAWFAECLVKAARDAVADLKPAQIGHGSFQAPEFVRNRLVGEQGAVDPEFSYLILKQTGGRTIILGSYSAHATVFSGRMMEFSADYPGYWQRALEQTAGADAIFLAGGVGSHGPRAGEGGETGAKKMGESLAKMLHDRIATTPLTNAITFGILSADITLPPLNTRLTDGIRLRPWVTRQLLPPEKPSFVQGFRLGDSIWLSTPCDFSGELALGIKDMLRGRGYHGVITSFNGDYIGYVILPRYYHLDGYEPRMMSFYGPNVPDYLDELVRTIATDLATAKSN